MVHNRVGPPVKGGDFFDREREQRQIWDCLERDHLLLLAPRRVGKTSLMLKLQHDAATHDIQASYLSAAEADNELGFVRRLFDAVAEIDAGAKAVREVSRSPLHRFFRRVRRVSLFHTGLEIDPDAADESSCSSSWPMRRRVALAPGAS